MSDTNRVRMSYCKEVTYGTMPNIALNDFRFTSDGLRYNSQFVRSNEIRSDRQTPDVVRVGASVAGPTAFELSLGAGTTSSPYGFPDDFHQAAVQSAGWSTQVSGAVSVTFTTGASQYTITRAAGSFVTDGYVANQWLKITGAADAANNGTGKIVSVAALTMVVKWNGNGTTQAVAASCTLKMGSQVVNGTTFTSFSIEKQFVDLTTTYAQYLGCGIDSLAMSLQTGQIATGTVNWLGQKELGPTASGGSGYTAAPTTSVNNAVDNITAIMENGSAVSLTKLDFTIPNNLRARMQIGSLNPISLGSGSIAPTGSMAAYFSSTSQYAKYLANTATSVAFIVTDAAGGQYVFEFPQIKLTAGDRVAGGKDQDVILNLSFEAYMNASESTTVRITRFI